MHFSIDSVPTAMKLEKGLFQAKCPYFTTSFRSSLNSLTPKVLADILQPNSDLPA